MKKFNPNWVSRPSATIKDVLERRGFSIDDLSSKLQMDKQFFDRFINDEIQIDESIANKLSEVIGSTPNFWMNRYNYYFEGVKAGKKIV